MKQGWVYSSFCLFFCFLLLEGGVNGYDSGLKTGTEKSVWYETTGAILSHTISGILRGIHIKGIEFEEQSDSNFSFFRSGIAVDIGRQTKKSVTAKFLLYLSVRSQQHSYLLLLRKLII